MSSNMSSKWFFGIGALVTLAGVGIMRLASGTWVAGITAFLLAMVWFLSLILSFVTLIAGRAKTEVDRKLEVFAYGVMLGGIGLVLIGLLPL